jgi:hypothetical protein
MVPNVLRFAAGAVSAHASALNGVDGDAARRSEGHDRHLVTSCAAAEERRPDSDGKRKWGADRPGRTVRPLSGHGKNKSKKKIVRCYVMDGRRIDRKRIFVLDRDLGNA